MYVLNNYCFLSGKEMRRIDVIHKELERLTYGLELSDLAKEKAFTAEAIGFNLGLARNSVSKDLNQLWNEGLVVKSQGRPVFFLHRHALELLINRKLDDCECIVHSVASLLPKKKNIQMMIRFPDLSDTTVVSVMR